jgi:DNA-binding NarL/FixJ family response regulator
LAPLAQLRTDRDSSTLQRPSRARILIVDDDSAMLTMAAEMLTSEDYAVVAHQRWEDAHRVAIASRADLVVIDLRFEPGEMGWRIIDHLRFDPSTRQIPIVLWSSAVAVLEARGPALLADDHVHVLAKPAGLEALAALVQRVLDADTGAAERAVSRGDSGPAELTRREREVARLVARGYGNKRLAEELVVTQGTAANHVAHILSKLGLANRTQLAVWAAARGLVDPPPVG